MKQKKIIIYGLGHRNGDSRIFYKQALSLKKKFDIECIWGIFSDKKGIWKEEGVKNIGIKGNRLLVLLKAWWHGIKNKADIYVAHDLDSYLVVVGIKLFKWKSKIIFDVHEYYEKMWNDKTLPKSHRIFYFIYTFILKPLTKSLFNGFTVVTPLMKEKFYKSRNTEIIYNFPLGKELDKISQNKKNNINNLQTLQNKFILIYQGGISKRRGILEYLKIINGLKEKIKNIHLLLIGPFESKNFKKEVENKSNQLSIKNYVTITGKLPLLEVYNYTINSHIGLNFLQNTFNNNYGIQIKIFEYLYLEKPILGTNNNVYFQQFIENNNCGLSVKYGDTEQAIKSIIQIYNNYDNFVENCKKVKNNYIWENEEKKLLEFYKKLLNYEK